MNVTLNGVVLEAWDVIRDPLPRAERHNSYVCPPSLASVLQPTVFLAPVGSLDYLASESKRWARKWGVNYPYGEAACVEGLFLDRACGPVVNEHTGRLHLWPGSVLMTGSGYERFFPTSGWKLPPELEGRMTASASRYGSPWWWAEADLEAKVITSV